MLPPLLPAVLHALLSSSIEESTVHWKLDNESLNDNLRSWPWTVGDRHLTVQLLTVDTSSLVLVITAYFFFDWLTDWLSCILILYMYVSAFVCFVGQGCGRSCGGCGLGFCHWWHRRLGCTVYRWWLWCTMFHARQSKVCEGGGRIGISILPSLWPIWRIRSKHLSNRQWPLCTALANCCPSHWEPSSLTALILNTATMPIATRQIK